MYYVQIHYIQYLKYTDFDICLCYIVIKYKMIPIVHPSITISFEYDLICYYDYWTDKNFEPAEI